MRSKLRLIQTLTPSARLTFKLLSEVRERFNHWRAINSITASESACSQYCNKVLLIGYFETGFGLGQSARGLASALEAVNEPFSIYPYNGYTGRIASDKSWSRKYSVTRAHEVNVFCMAADQTKAARRIIGPRMTSKSYNILSTFWELERAPQDWTEDLSFFDEVWVPNDFVAGAFRHIFKKRISIVSPCVDVTTSKESNEALLNLESEIFYFCFSFDYNSGPARKNPLGVVDAFRMAFSANDKRVGLIIKSNGAQVRYSTVRDALDEAARKDSRIRVIHREMSRDQILTLFKSIDCYVSLHRSEGFGLGMAECMLLAKGVVGTAYSGNSDFLNSETGFPVKYQLAPVGDDYPHGRGQMWAEPDILYSAEMLRKAFEMKDLRQQRAKTGQAFVQSRYSAMTVGQTARNRINEIINS